MSLHQIRRALSCLLAASFIASLVLPSPVARSFNSEEHKLLGELGAAGIIAPEGFFPLGVAFFNITKAEDLAAYTSAKLFAVGFATNDPESDYDEDLKKAQDNSYYTGFGQSGALDDPFEGNLWMWIPPEDYLVERRLELTMGEDPTARLTFGQLVAFYGDFRKTPYCVDGACYVTNADTPMTSFEAGKDWFLNPFNNGWRPDPMPTSTYIQYIASGLWPPYGSGGNALSNTADDTEYEEAGWWGDELLRNAAVNDWHFATGALSWYVGMHRLAIHYAQLAVQDPNYWATALHYEANAVHSYTDLFAFGHVMTHRDAASYGIVEEEGGGLIEGETYQWMQAVMSMGGAQRVESDCKGLGNFTCRRLEYPSGTVVLPELQEPPHGRLDFLPAYAPGAWTNWTLKEKRYHTAFNAAGACVRNLRGEAYFTYGDSRLRFMVPNQVQTQSTLCGVGTRDAMGVIADGVKASLQSLFDAYQAAAAGQVVEDTPGSPIFAALAYLPAFVISNPNDAITSLAGITFDYGSGHFTGRWVTYAGPMEVLAGTSTLPGAWNACAVPYIDGGESLPDEDQPACTAFPLIGTPNPATTVPGGSVQFLAAGGSDAALYPADAGYVWSVETSGSGATIDAQTGLYVAGPVGGVEDVVKLTDGLGATVLVTVAVQALAAEPGPEVAEAGPEAPVDEAGSEVVADAGPDVGTGPDAGSDLGQDSGDDGGGGNGSVDAQTPGSGQSGETTGCAGGSDSTPFGVLCSLIGWVLIRRRLGVELR